MAQPIKIAIVGGGCSGLSSAAALTKRGFSVTVFESAHQLGGRTRGIEYQGLKLDNGQHIMLGAYHETLRLLAMADVDTTKYCMRLPLKLDMHHMTHAHHVSLNTPSYLPAPFHLLTGLMTAKGLPWSDKWAAIRFMLWAKRIHFKLKRDISLEELFQHQQQSIALIQFLWEPLCLAALNTPLHQASSQVFLHVLRDSFTRRKSDSDFILPRVDLTELIITPLAKLIRKQGGEIRTGEKITAIKQTAIGFELIGSDISEEFSHLVLAIAPHQLKHISLPAALSFKMNNLNYQAITTVYLQYETNIVLPQIMMGLVGSLAQWVFDRGQLYGQRGLFAIVISAHTPFEQSHEVLAQQVHAELNKLFPQLGAPLWHKVISEKRATFSCDANANRPMSETNITNLWLAGDYIASDYPATIEGAIRSGLSVANML